MLNSKCLLFYSCFFLIFNCDVSKTVSVKENKLQKKKSLIVEKKQQIDVYFQNILSTLHSNIEIKKIFLIKEKRQLDSFLNSQQNFARFFEKKLKKNQAFDRGGYFVVLAMGFCPTGGHQIEIKKIKQVDSKLVVYALETYPSFNCVVTESFVYPIQVVKVFNSNLSIPSLVEVIREKKINNCKGN